MLAAFRVHYRYMGLIQIGRRELTEQQAKLETAKTYMERQRDSAAR